MPCKDCLPQHDHGLKEGFKQGEKSNLMNVRTQVECWRNEAKALRDKWAQHALGQSQDSTARGISFAKSLHCETETEAYQRVLNLIDTRGGDSNDAGGPSDPRE